MMSDEKAGQVACGLVDEQIVEKPWLDGLALAFETSSRAKANIGPSPMARLGLAYLGLAWPGPWPEARPGTALMVWEGTRWAREQEHQTGMCICCSHWPSSN